MKIKKIIFLLLFFQFAIVSSVVQAQEWLRKYKTDNTRLAQLPVEKDRVVFMGNSITEGWGSRPQFFEGKPWINRGGSGQCTSNMLLRFRADVINLNPKIVIILGGTNDIAENGGPFEFEFSQNNIASMAMLAKANGIRVILCSILPVYEYPWRKEIVDPVGKIAAMNEWIKNYAAENKHIYLDYYSVMVDVRKGLKAEFTTDGVHCSPKGYALMESLVVPAIKKALK